MVAVRIENDKIKLANFEINNYNKRGQFKK